MEVTTRAIGAFRIVSLILIPANAFAQREHSSARAAPQKAPQPFTVQDGGTQEVLAPLTLTLETEWVKALFDGETITLVNKRRIARDSTVRIYQERWLLVPKNGKAELVMNAIQISDPNAHTHYNCFVLEEPHVCVLTMLSIRSDPRFGKQTFAAMNLIFSEPDPKLFELPDGCRVEDRRSSSPPEVN